MTPYTGLCQFTTTTPESPLRQPARHRAGSPRHGTRYKRCRNTAHHQILIDGRQVECCGLHRRLHEEQGWRP